MWSKIFAPVVFSVLLAGCAAPAVVVQCPSLVEYDRAFMQRLADEVDRLPSESAIVRAIIDYRRLRDLTRACGG